MFISIANAATDMATQAPSTGDAFWGNMGLVGVMFVLFYVLMIRPQQKRMKEQRELLDNLQVGDKVVTGGGLYGTITKLVSDTEVEIDLGGSKVVAVRYTIQTRVDNDNSAVKAAAKPAVEKAEEPKKPAAKKKTTAAKKAPAKKTATRKPAATAKKAPAKKKTATKKA